MRPVEDVLLKTLEDLAKKGEKEQEILSLYLDISKYRLHNGALKAGLFFNAAFVAAVVVGVIGIIREEAPFWLEIFIIPGLVVVLILFMLELWLKDIARTLLHSVLFGHRTTTKKIQDKTHG